MNFPSYKKCSGCGATFCGGPSQRKCFECLAKAQQRKRWARRTGYSAWRAYAPTPYREALAQGDADMANAALRGELD